MATAMPTEQYGIWPQEATPRPVARLFRPDSKATGRSWSSTSTAAAGSEVARKSYILFRAGAERQLRRGDRRVSPERDYPGPLGILRLQATVRWVRSNAKSWRAVPTASAFAAARPVVAISPRSGVRPWPTAMSRKGRTGGAHAAAVLRPGAVRRRPHSGGRLRSLLRANHLANPTAKRAQMVVRQLLGGTPDDGPGRPLRCP